MDTSLTIIDFLPLEFATLQLPGHLLKWTLFATCCLFLLYFQSVSKHQRLVPSIPIVGGSDKESIKKNRLRFIHDGKSMLEEGYKKVRYSYSFYTQA